jgi:hypothetical protein
MQVIKPPNPLPTSFLYTSIFLGGTIDMGNSVDWQTEFSSHFVEYQDNIVILNPRRDDWDSSWSQEPTPGTSFHTQVMWERTAQQFAVFRVYNFEPNSVSPITLLELGEYGRKKNTYVRCSPEYFRYGNVAMFCYEHGIPIFNELNPIINIIKGKL